jgi:hypothetical protein
LSSRALALGNPKILRFLATGIGEMRDGARNTQVFAVAKFFRRLQPSWRQGGAGNLVAEAQNQPDLIFAERPRLYFNSLAQQAFLDRELLPVCVRAAAAIAPARVPI